MFEAWFIVSINNPNRENDNAENKQLEVTKMAQDAPQ